MAVDPSTDPLFAWIPRWRDKLVLEAWSLGTFMRLKWWEDNEADVEVVAAVVRASACRGPKACRP